MDYCQQTYWNNLNKNYWLLPTNYWDILIKTIDYYQQNFEIF